MTVSPDVFIEFSRKKLAADGSDAYIMGAVELARQSDDPLWHAGVFTTFYAPPANEIVCDRWSRQDVLERPHQFRDWVEANWKGLPMSGARRTGAFTPIKVMTALLGWANSLEDRQLEFIAATNGDDFETAFREFLKCAPYHGRYTGLKLYETVRRLGVELPVVNSIVPRGGKTPRKGLAMIFPGHDPRSNEGWALRQAEDYSEDLRKEVGTTTFNIEMLLCNFSKAVKGSYYPGHALDRELVHIAKAEAWFNPWCASKLRAVRPKLYPRACLGEFGGWDSTRKELERYYPETGHFWSDLYAAGAPLTPVIGFGEEGST